jgi:hypothetical protein
MFFTGMRYDAPGTFAVPGAVGSPDISNLKWHRQLYEGLKDLGSQGLRTGRVKGLTMSLTIEFWKDWSYVCWYRMCA